MKVAEHAGIIENTPIDVTVNYQITYLFHKKENPIFSLIHCNHRSNCNQDDLRKSSTAYFCSGKY